MALFDDRRFLLSHINHSFITGDDTGLCEVVMLDEDVFENQHQRCLKLAGQVEEEEEKDSSMPLPEEAYDLNYESDLIDSEQGQSYDIISDMDYICHRRRSNTAQRLERLRKEKLNQSKTKTIVWRHNTNTNNQSDDRQLPDSPTSLNEQDEDDIETEQAIKEQSKNLPCKSGLTRLLEKYPSLPKNPFDEYAQFDGGMSETVPVKKIMIFIALNYHNQQQQQLAVDDNKAIDLSSQSSAIYKPSTSKQPNDTFVGEANSSQSLPISNQTESLSNNINSDKNLPVGTTTKPSQNEPLEVVIVSSARVQDLIGLICWQYTNEGREPRLTGHINDYCLRIAEDNGEVDPDFTSLNPKEPLSKFNFPSLALTEKAEERRTTSTYQPNGSVYSHDMPSMAQRYPVISSTTKVSTYSKLAAFTRIIFRDAKLESD